MKRMSMRRFCKVVSRVLETLPEEFYPHMGNLVVDVEEEPGAELLRRQGFTEEEIAEGESLYGLFVPLELRDGYGGETYDLGDLPRRLIIFKRPLEEDFPERRELLREIRKTVIHELAHHFGFTERDLDRFEETPDPFKDNLEEFGGAAESGSGFG
jgi:predicted Zn-dependent protease with MMP-like domain